LGSIFKNIKENVKDSHYFYLLFSLIISHKFEKRELRLRFAITTDTENRMSFLDYY